MEKKLIIESINAIIREHGSFTKDDLNITEPPVINCGNGMIELPRIYEENGCHTSIYVGAEVSDYSYEFYEDLSENILEEILLISQSWEVDCLKAEKRCKS